MNLNELEALAKAATPGPWMHNDYFSVVQTHSNEVSLSAVCRKGNSDEPEATLAFIAAANPETILALITLVREMADELSVNEKRGHYCYSNALTKYKGMTK
jgi:hypothetical protein